MPTVTEPADGTNAESATDIDAPATEAEPVEATPIETAAHPSGIQVVGATGDEEAAIRPVLDLVPPPSAIVRVEFADVDGGRGLTIVLPDRERGVSIQACWETGLILDDVLDALDGLVSATITGERGQGAYCYPDSAVPFTGDRSTVEREIRRRASGAGFDLAELRVFGDRWLAVRAAVRLREDQLLEHFANGFVGALFDDPLGTPDPYAYFVVVESPEGRGLHSWWAIPSAAPPGSGVGVGASYGGDSWWDVARRPTGQPNDLGRTLLHVRFEQSVAPARTREFTLRCDGEPSGLPNATEVCADVLADPWPLLMPVEIPLSHGETVDRVTITGTLDGEAVDRSYSNTGYWGVLVRWQHLFGVEPLPGFGSLSDIEPVNVIEARAQMPLPPPTPVEPPPP